jgi:hypothetical protein
MANNTLLAETLTELETLLQNIRDLKSWKEGLTILQTETNSPSGLLQLDDDGLIPTAQLPAVASGVHVYTAQCSAPASDLTIGGAPSGGVIAWNVATNTFVCIYPSTAAVNAKFYTYWGGAEKFGTPTAEGVTPIEGALYMYKGEDNTYQWTWDNGAQLKAAKAETEKASVPPGGSSKRVIVGKNAKKGQEGNPQSWNKYLKKIYYDSDEGYYYFENHTWDINNFNKRDTLPIKIEDVHKDIIQVDEEKYYSFYGVVYYNWDTEQWCARCLNSTDEIKRLPPPTLAEVESFFAFSNKWSRNVREIPHGSNTHYNCLTPIPVCINWHFEFQRATRKGNFSRKNHLCIDFSRRVFRVRRLNHNRNQIMASEWRTFLVQLNKGATQTNERDEIYCRFLEEL